MEIDNLTFASAAESFQSRYRVNTNFLQSSKFAFACHNTPYLNYFSQSLQLPGVSAGEIPQDTPLSTIYRAGDKIQFEPLTINFLVDEDIRIWEETYNWMTGFTFPLTDKQYTIRRDTKGIYTDMTMFMFTNNNTDNLRIKFRNCFPVFLGPIAMNAMENAEVVMQSDLTIRFDYFEIQRVRSS